MGIRVRLDIDFEFDTDEMLLHELSQLCRDLYCQIRDVKSGERSEVQINYDGMSRHKTVEARICKCGHPYSAHSRATETEYCCVCKCIGYEQ